MEMNNVQNLGMSDGGGERKKKGWWWLLSAVVLVLVVWGGWFWLGKSSKKIETQPQPVGKEVPVEKVDPEKLTALGKLFLESDSLTVKKGQKITVAVYGDTGGYDMSAVGFTLKYDQNQLELEGKADYTGAVMSMGAVENKEPGRVNIVRGQVGDGDWKDSDDGFNGSRGLLAKLIFKAKTAGEGEITFWPEESSLILDDARGTAVKMEYTGLKYVIN